ncbi:MAG TPA: hypothetical protein PKI11_05625 [Candidatus Hydrogenedentes bacterium]|nr:hypothetical protein [Candidatus Hydrogenedentota bacterium]HNT86431.1 hypothetical protein [Candidatus Hydrogenedentota bacterium]
MLARSAVVVAVLAAVVLSGCPCGNPDLPVTLIPLSGPFGYAVRGPYGLEGHLTKENLTDAEWRLRGSFQFPNSGYAVLGPEVLVMESYPEQVLIRLRVLLPAPGTITLPVITERPVAVDVAASNEAVFTVVVQERCAPAL